MEGYLKYKWFYTSSGKLVVGGKSAGQNDELLNKVTQSNSEKIVMHTSSPGSPFCVIIADVNGVTKKDLDQTAIFTGCFSRAWKEGKKKIQVDIFKSSQLSKEKRMKTGTWGVHGKVRRVKVELKLALAKQKNILRGVPEGAVKKKEILVMVCPGKIGKDKMLVRLFMEIDDDKLNKNEILAALPAGGVRVCRGSKR